jgi:spore maturation protein CgeB
VPDEALAQAAAFTPQVVVCLGGGLVVLPEDRRRFLPEAVVVGIALSDPQALPTSLAIAPHFHLFYTQDFQCLSAYAAAGIAAGRFDLAADPEDFYHLPLDKRWDVVFVGKWTPYREKLLKALAQRVSVAIFTHEGESRWGLPTQGPLVTTQQLCLAFNQARMALDVAYVDESPAGLATYPPRITPRAFMAAACATPVLVEACASVEAFFLPGVEIATFSTLEEAVEVAGRLVGDERALVAMGKAARERVLRQHLWEGRVVQVLRQAYALWHSERAK